MRENFKFISLALCLIFCLTAAAFGQETGGAIEGTVKDPSGAIVPGAVVTVRSTGNTTGFNRTITADSDGFFRVLEVPSGTYNVTVAAISGFGERTVSDVTVTLGKTIPVDVTLQAGGGTATVDVSATDSSPIDPTDTKLQTVINQQTFERLPKGVNFSSALRVDPAVRPEPLAAGFQIDGASGAENTFIIDGQEVTNFRTGQLNVNNNIPFQFVQEVQVKTSGFEAEFGGATGGVINVVTRGGGNQYNGEFGIQFQPAKLQAGPRPFQNRFVTGGLATAANPTNVFNQNLEYFRPIRNEGTNVFPTGNLSGPIIKDKLFFFGSYTPQIFVADRTINYFSSSNPATRTLVDTQTYRLKQTNNYAFLRLDANPTDKLRLTGTYTWNPVVQVGNLDVATNSFGGTAAVPSFIQPNGTTTRGAEFFNQQGGRQNSNNVTGKLIYTPTSKSVISVRAGRSFLNEKLGSYGIPDATQIVCSNAGLGNAQFGATGAGLCASGITSSNFPSNFITQKDVSIRTTVDADATYLLNNFGGRHQFKGGYQLNRLSNDVNAGYFNRGVVTLYFGQSLCNILGEPGDRELADCSTGALGAGTIGSGRIRQFSTVGNVKSKSQGFFVQDSWQPFNRLSINLGLRAEKEDVPSFREGAPGLNFGLGDKIAPRLGVAFDLRGNGKTKLFASFGRFFDRFKYELPRGSFGGDQFFDTYFTLPAGLPNSTQFTLQQICGVSSGLCPVRSRLTAGTTAIPTTNLGLYQFDFRVPSNNPSDNRIDPDLKAARQTEYTVGFENDLGNQFVVAARYTHKQLDRAIEDVGFLDNGGNENYFIANPGFGVVANSFATGIAATPKAERKYDALEIRLDKRFSKDYYFNASYTRSRLFGNYSGLASSDEAGRSSPNVNRFFDLPFLGYTANGQPDNGRLATDRPNVFKFSGGYTLGYDRFFGSEFGKNNSTDFSTFFVAQSGTPLTSTYLFYNVPAILNFRGDLGRTKRFTQTDFAITHRYAFGRDNRFTLAADLNILNLFNQATEVTRNTQISLGNFTATSLNITGATTPFFAAGATEVDAIRRIFNGGIANQVRARIAAGATNTATTGGSTTLRQDIRYNQPNGFQDPRSVRFGFRLLF